MATLEAMAYRTAVLITPGCFLPEAGEAGAATIVPKDAEAVGSAMRALLADPARLRRMGEAGRRFVEERYSWDAVTDRLIEVYAEHRESSGTRGRR